MHLFKPNPSCDIVGELAAISKELRRGGDGWSYDIAGACTAAAECVIDLRKKVADLQTEVDRLKEAQKTACDKCPGLGLMVSHGYGTVKPLPASPVTEEGMP